ncbi:MAG: AbrB/MazE/SpoVT family DNA-binding domain-containing protein [Chloroflexi bacterium]|nr:AbrB/MazE/SpoVT family DNA-binding domain-containing protein [Chloroflexota bacterium]
MRMITVSGKNQITIPVAILREVGINPGDRMAAAVIDGDIVLIKEPESWVEYFQGSMRGAYGGSRESIDRYVLRERESWYEPMSEHISQSDPREWRKQFEDLYATDRGVRAITDTLMGCPHHVATLPDLEERVPEDAGPAGLSQALDTLTTHFWVRRIPGPAPEPERYRLDGEIAASLRAA